MTIKSIICTLSGVFGSAITYLFGGWTMALATLVFFMAADFITGLLVAAVFGKSNKSENGALSSKASFFGLCKKFVILLFVAIAYRLDVFLNVNFLYNAVIIGFMVSELISIVENAGLMGIKSVPIEKAIDILKKKLDEGSETDENK